MDTSVEDIIFNKDGICNFCINAEKKLIELNKKKENNYFQKVIFKMKKDGSNKKYDCIVGVSGGVDSTYLLHLLVKNDIRPFVLHLDNGWNTELSVKNIFNLLDKLNLDLNTHVINWNEFKMLQRSFLKSSLSNLEIPTDHAIFSLLFNYADKLNCKYIIHGGNQVSESIMPKSWMESSWDQKLIFSINKKFENQELSTYPTQNYITLFNRIFFKKIKYIGLLNFFDYNVSSAKKIISKLYGWEPYKHKHGESFFTNFFQNYILPKKFNINKKKAHLSSLIISNQISRNDAIKKISIEEDIFDIDQDIDYFCSKLEISMDEFLNYMKSPRIKINNYPNHQTYFEKISKFLILVRKFSTNI